MTVPQIGEFGDLSPASDTMQTFSVNLNGSEVTSAYNVTMLEEYVAVALIFSINSCMFVI